MSRLRALRKLLIAGLVFLCIAVALLLAAGQIEQHVFRRRVERLLADIQWIELRKTDWPEVQARFRKWDNYSTTDPGCTSRRCALQISLNEAVYAYVSQRNLFQKLDDYFRWRLGLSYDAGPFSTTELWLLRQYMRVGGHPARVGATIGMRDGKAWSKGIWVSIETYEQYDEGADSQDFQFVLLADVKSSPRFEFYGVPWISKQLVLHPTYLIGRPGGCEGCVEGWIKFTPYTPPEDVRRLFDLNLSCFTRWHSCVSQSDILPAAWAQYSREQPDPYKPEPHPGCSPAVLEILGRDSASISTGQIVSYRESSNENGYKKKVATVRVLERIKGTAGWNPGETREIAILSGTPCSEEKLHVGSRLIFYGGLDSIAEREPKPHYQWLVVPLNESNLASLQRGIAQDYTSNDNSKQ